MDKIRIRGGPALEGKIRIGGQERRLPLLTTCLLTDEPVTLTSLPRLADIDTMAQSPWCSTASPSR